MLNHNKRRIPVIDLFAGPGGLGEGFSAYQVGSSLPFEVRLSVEKERAAHETLELRAFFRRFRDSKVPEGYYQFVRGEIDRQELYERYPEEANAAQQEACHAELGRQGVAAEELDEWVAQALGDAETWVLIGGPPCQAYSIAGRSRQTGVKGYTLEQDPRHDLYKEYLRVIARHWPTVFVMENVKGLLSSRVKGDLILTRMLEDLSDPGSAVTEGQTTDGSGYCYQIYSLVETTQPGLDGIPLNPANEFLIECENYGVPQMRHRVILLGVRDDLRTAPGTLGMSEKVTAADVLEGLPRLRGGLSRDTQGNISHSADSKEGWKEAIRQMLNKELRRGIEQRGGPDVLRLIDDAIRKLRVPKWDRGAEFVRHRARIKYKPEWFLDARLDGVCNSMTRVHIADDLHRYLYAACFAEIHGKSPRLGEFPEQLWPKHRNVAKSLKSDNFSDRFRVQLGDRPATTVVSHIAKDGHYYIHYDKTQARSLTVREAARLQTFPDNYFFCGNRTEQYTQVGNAVPPLLARQIAKVVFNLVLEESEHGRRAIA